VLYLSFPDFLENLLVLRVEFPFQAVEDALDASCRDLESVMMCQEFPDSFERCPQPVL